MNTESGGGSHIVVLSRFQKAKKVLSWGKIATDLTQKPQESIIMILFNTDSFSFEKDVIYQQVWQSSN